MPDQRPPAREDVDDADDTAETALQQETAALEASPQTGADCTDANTDEPADTPPSAAWGVSSGGTVVPSLPLLSQLYAARRTSDRPPPAARRSTAEAPAAQRPAGSAATSPTTSPVELVQQEETAAAAADADAVAASPTAPFVQDPAGHRAADGDVMPAVDEEDVALVALAEREAFSCSDFWPSVMICTVWLAAHFPAGCYMRQAVVAACPAGLFKEADANASGGLDRKEFWNVMRSMELGLSTA